MKMKSSVKIAILAVLAIAFGALVFIYVSQTKECRNAANEFELAGIAEIEQKLANGTSPEDAMKGFQLGAEKGGFVAVVDNASGNFEYIVFRSLIGKPAADYEFDYSDGATGVLKINGNAYYYNAKQVAGGRTLVAGYPEKLIYAERNNSAITFIICLAIALLFLAIAINKTLGQGILFFILTVYAVLCALPLILVFISAFTDEQTLALEGFSYFPSKFSTSGFNAVLKYGKLLASAYGITIFITVVGTLLGLLIMCMFAYAVSRKEFRMRGFLSIYAMIPMLFSGGQLSCYIIFTSTYNLKDSLLLLILPLTVSTMNIIILRTYIQTSVPEELMDSARIDGAGEGRTFFGIVLPLMKPALAAVGFMMATAYWNEWQNAFLYITTSSKKPLQLLLINIQNSIETLLNTRNIPSEALAAMQGTIPQYSATMATVVTVIGPIIILYPFFQKYFAKGLTMGSVKG